MIRIIIIQPIYGHATLFLNVAFIMFLPNTEWDLKKQLK